MSTIPEELSLLKKKGSFEWKGFLIEPLTNSFFSKEFFRWKWFWVEPKPFKRNSFDAIISKSIPVLLSLCVYQTPQAGCYYGDRSWMLPPPPLPCFYKPLILDTWNVPFKVINYVCVVSIQSHSSELIISLSGIPATLHMNCFPSPHFPFVSLVF